VQGVQLVMLQQLIIQLRRVINYGTTF